MNRHSIETLFTDILSLKTLQAIVCDLEHAAHHDASLWLGIAEDCIEIRYAAGEGAPPLVATDLGRAQS